MINYFIKLTRGNDTDFYGKRGHRFHIDKNRNISKDYLWLHRYCERFGITNSDTLDKNIDKLYEAGCSWEALEVIAVDDNSSFEVVTASTSVDQSIRELLARVYNYGTAHCMENGSVNLGDEFEMRADFTDGKTGIIKFIITEERQPDIDLSLYDSNGDLLNTKRIHLSHDPWNYYCLGGFGGKLYIMNVGCSYSNPYDSRAWW